MLLLCFPLPPNLSFSKTTLFTCPAPGVFFTQKSFRVQCQGISPAFPSNGKTKSKNPYDEKRLLEQNRRIQRENSAPEDFPNFVREGFTVKVVAPEKYVKRDSGLILWDIAVGKGDSPEVTFHYVGYNESGRRIDSTYIQGTPAKIWLGTNAMVPGFEEGIRDMKRDGKRRTVIPPELGPPTHWDLGFGSDLLKTDQDFPPFSAQNNSKFLMWNWSAFKIAKGEQ